MNKIKKIGAFLIEQNLEIATAESITGGLIASKLVSVSGISSVFKQGFVTYSNEAKINLLGVKSKTIKEHGAVSEETARQMAYYVKKTSRANIGVASTGIADKGGESTTKPIGLCFVSVAIDDVVVTRRFIFKGSRNKVRNKCTDAAIDLLLDCLLEYYK